MGLFCTFFSPKEDEMRGAATRLAGQGNYRFDAEGNLIVDEAESEEHRVAVEAAVLYKEGMSPNHPADIATHNAAEGGEEPPEEPPVEGETAEEEAARTQRNDETRKRWAAYRRREEAAYPEEAQAQEPDDTPQEGYEAAQPEAEEDSRRGQRRRDRERERNR
jgi:hypothetical protein